MKIHLINRYFDFTNAGLGRVALTIRDGLEKRGHTVTCTSSDDNNNLFKYAFFTYLKGRWQVPNGKDIYHAITPVESQCIDVWKPLITTMCDLIPILHPETMGAGASNKLMKLAAITSFKLGVDYAIENSKFISVISEDVKDELLEYGGKRIKCPVNVIRLGIRNDLQVIPNKHDRFTIGYIGQLDGRKRVDLLIKAFVRDNPKDALLYIAGRGRDEVYLRSLCLDNPNIIFKGFIPDNELVNFYNSLDLFVFPTACEGYGLPIVEALACGIPVVVLEDAIIPKDVKSKCIFAESLDINTLIEDVPIYGKVSDKTITWAQAHKWSNTIEGYLKLYEQTITSR
jgi:glycosyltransferase involved in cell wall biosynthesis